MDASTSIDWEARRATAGAAAVTEYRTSVQPTRRASQSDQEALHEEQAAWSSFLSQHLEAERALAESAALRDREARAEGMVPLSSSSAPQFGKLTPEHVAWLSRKLKRYGDLIVAVHLTANASPRDNVCRQTPTQIARALDMHRSSVSQSLGRLCNLGAAERIEDGYCVFRWSGDMHKLPTRKDGAQ